MDRCGHYSGQLEGYFGYQWISIVAYQEMSMQYNYNFDDDGILIEIRGSFNPVILLEVKRQNHLKIGNDYDH